MKSILEEFAHDNISTEPRFFKHNSEYGKAMQVLSDSEEKLLAVLNTSEQELLKTFVKAQDKVDSISNIDRFIYGYRLGVLMTMEVFAGKEDLIVGGEGC